MNPLSPQPSILQRSQSTSQSDNSHSSESATSHLSSASSNTSCSTDLQVIAPSVLPLPKGASPPQVRTDSYGLPGASSIPRQQQSNKIVEALPSAGHSGEQPKKGMKKRAPFRTSVRGPSSRSPLRGRIFSNDEALVIEENGELSTSPRRSPFFSTPPPPSAYGSIQRSRSETRSRSHSPMRIPSDSKLPSSGDDISLPRKCKRLSATESLMSSNKPLSSRSGRPYYPTGSDSDSDTKFFSFKGPSRILRYSTPPVVTSSKQDGEFEDSTRSTDVQPMANKPEVTYTSHSSPRHARGVIPPLLRAGYGSSRTPTMLDESEASYRSFGSYYFGDPSFSSSSPSEEHPSTSTPPFRVKSAPPNPSNFTVPRSSPSVPSYSYEAPSLDQLAKSTLRKCIKRAFSFGIFSASKEATDGAQDLPDPYSEGPRDIAQFGDSPVHVPRSENSADHPQVRAPQRKLHKSRPASHSAFLVSTPTPGSVSSNSIVELKQHHYPSPEPNLRKRTRSSPVGPEQGVTSTLVPPLPTTFQSNPATSSSDAQVPLVSTSQSSPKKALWYERLDSSSKKLEKPVRVASPLELNTNGSPLSQASRSHSTPNIWPRGPDRSPMSYLSSRQSITPVLHRNATDSWRSSLHSEKVLRPASPKGKETRPSPLQSQPGRRWTLAASEVPDEQLATELDRLRSVGWGLGFQGELVRFEEDNGQRSKDGEKAKWGKAEDEKWIVARQALMVCREILRTEKSYKEAIIRLQRGETDRLPPPLLLQYLPALVSASQDFSARLDDDPSTWGVSAAFIGMEDILDTALVAWSGIVGDFFSSDKGKQRRRQSTGLGDKDKRDKEKKVVTGAPILPPIGSSALEEEERRVEDIYVTPKSSPSIWGMSVPGLSQLLTSPNDPHHTQSHKSLQSSSRVSALSTKTPTVQDLAIQPTQRVMRYVLLYKDLLNCTPVSSPSRPLVERALEGATRIAQRCNRAQDNAAFLT